jgi:cytoskeletal protein CcmA (bactofilin family)
VQRWSSQDQATLSRPLTTKSARSLSAGANVIGPSVRVRGRLAGEGDVRIEGHIDGEVQVTGALSIDARATVKGNTTARSVDVEGALVGDISAEGAVHIRGGANVTGNVSGAEVALDEGAAFSGRIDADFELPDGLEGVSAAPAAVRRKR